MLAGIKRVVTEVQLTPFLPLKFTITGRSNSYSFIIPARKQFNNLSSDVQVELAGNERDIRFTGSQINYYFICKRKLWLFSHNIELEPESDLVKLGKLLHENRYKRRMKEVQVDRIKIDFVENKRVPVEGKVAVAEESAGSISKTDTAIIEKNFPEPQQSRYVETVETSSGTQPSIKQQRELVIHEVKRSKKMQDAHLNQLLYYMYYLKRNYGVNVSRGVLHYPLLKQNVDVPLTEDRIRQVEEAMQGITEVNSLSSPPEATRKAYCRSCAYQDLCWG